jgi:hypothetical protein
MYVWVWNSRVVTPSSLWHDKVHTQDMIYVRLYFFTMVTVKNAVFWDIKTRLIPHRRHITSPLQSPFGFFYVRFEVFTAVTMKNVVFWDIKTQFVFHRRLITSPPQSPAS